MNPNVAKIFVFLRAICVIARFMRLLCLISFRSRLFSVGPRALKKNSLKPLRI